MRESAPSTAAGSWDGFWSDRDEMSEFARLSWQMAFEFWDDVFLAMAPGKELLECGAGSAKHSQRLASLGFRPTLLDNSMVGLDLGRREFQRRRLHGRFLVGSVFELPFHDNEFDAVFSGGLLEHFEDVRPVIGEMVRVLKPGGLFAATIITKRFSCQSLADYTLNFTARFAGRAATGRFEDIIRMSGRRFPFYENSISIDTYRAVIREAGVERVVVTGIDPFPALALPRSVEDRVYVPVLRALTPVWRRFNRSPSRLSDMWGQAWAAYGVKKRG